jgi:hypothetical protein
MIKIKITKYREEKYIGKSYLYAASSPTGPGGVIIINSIKDDKVICTHFHFSSQELTEEAVMPIINIEKHLRSGWWEEVL